MIIALLSALWSRRPRWHRTPAFAAGRSVGELVVRRFPQPREDSVLDALARHGGDLRAHQLVHMGRGSDERDRFRR